MKKEEKEKEKEKEKEEKEKGSYSFHMVHFSCGWHLKPSVSSALFLSLSLSFSNFSVYFL